MRVNFDPLKGATAISFKPGEEELVFLIQFVFEEEWEKGTLVPAAFMDAAYFEKLAVSETKEETFSFCYLEFVIAYLVAVRKKLLNGGADVSELENVMDEIEAWRFGEWFPTSGLWTIH